MTRTRRLAIGIIAAAPVAGVALLALTLVDRGGLAAVMAGEGLGRALQSSASDFPTWAFVMVLTLFWAAAVYIYFLGHIASNARLQVRQKTLWIMAVILGHLLMPLNFAFVLAYWYLHIWRDQHLVLVES